MTDTEQLLLRAVGLHLLDEVRRALGADEETFTDADTPLPEVTTDTRTTGDTCTVRCSRLRADDSERGDVPGWVLITIMTTGLVTALWLIAADLLVELFVNAVSAVTGP